MESNVSIIDIIWLISSVGVFVFGVTQTHRILFLLSLIIMLLVFTADWFMDYGVAGIFYAALSLAGLIFGTWLVAIVIMHFLWKEVSKGTEDEGKPAPGDKGIKEFLKSVFGMNS